MPPPPMPPGGPPPKPPPGPNGPPPPPPKRPPPAPPKPPPPRSGPVDPPPAGSDPGPPPPGGNPPDRPGAPPGPLPGPPPRPPPPGAPPSARSMSASRPDPPPRPGVPGLRTDEPGNLPTDCTDLTRSSRGPESWAWADDHARVGRRREARVIARDKAGAELQIVADPPHIGFDQQPLRAAEVGEVVRRGCVRPASRPARHGPRPARADRPAPRRHLRA